MNSIAAKKWLDLGERVVMTYVQAVVGLLLGDSAHMLSLSAVHVAAVAALPAGIAAVKAALALGFGPSGSASLLPGPAVSADGRRPPKPLPHR